MTEIEQLKGQIKVLEKKLALLEQIEKHKTPVEKAYRDAYGYYPVTDDMSGSDIDYVSWDAFQKGYTAAYEEKVSEEPEEQIKNAVRESVKWCEEHPDKDPLDCLKPQTPEQVADGLKEAFREAVKQGVVSSTKSPTLYDVIADWWDDTFTKKETSLQELVDAIEQWLPKEQSAAGSQNAYVESAVEGFNDAINKIKRKLR